MLLYLVYEGRTQPNERNYSITLGRCQQRIGMFIIELTNGVWLLQKYQGKIRAFQAAKAVAECPEIFYSKHEMKNIQQGKYTTIQQGC